MAVRRFLAGSNVIASNCRFGTMGSKARANSIKLEMPSLSSSANCEPAGSPLDRAEAVQKDLTTAVKWREVAVPALSAALIMKERVRCVLGTAPMTLEVSRKNVAGARCPSRPKSR